MTQTTSSLTRNIPGTELDVRHLRQLLGQILRPEQAEPDALSWVGALFGWLPANGTGR